MIRSASLEQHAGEVKKTTEEYESQTHQVSTLAPTVSTARFQLTTEDL